MKCSRCQHDNPANAKFCLECGARLAQTCPNCRSELPLSAKFCRPLPCSAGTCHTRCCRRIAEGPEETLRRGLGNLRAAEFLYEARLFPDLEYTFKHALTHEVAYGFLSRRSKSASSFETH